MDKIDGPYYFFKLIQRMRQLLPPWMPSIGLEGGRINIVPVDFVVAALDHISHLKTDLDKRCFHLVDPLGYRVGDVLDIFSKAAHAPKMNLFVNAALLGFIPKSVKKGLMALAPVRRVKAAVLKDLGLPEDMLTFINFPTRYDCRETLAALKGSGIECPQAARLRLAPLGLLGAPSRSGAADRPLAARHGRRQGRARHRRLVGHRPGGGDASSPRPARSPSSARATRPSWSRRSARSSPRQARARSSRPSRPTSPTRRAARRSSTGSTTKHGGVDFLINNAGRSIRRAIEASYDRFHDFERTMQLNYFGCLRVTMGFLPGMVAKKKGHIVNISSIGVLTNAPRFSAYVASKAALDAWTRCASSEYADMGITFTTINMPLVRTPMIGPTKIYDNVPVLAPEDAAEHDRRGVRRQAGADRDAAGHHRRADARARAAGGADRHELDLPDVPGQRGGQGRQGQEVPAVGRGGGDGADDARHPFLTRLDCAGRASAGWRRRRLAARCELRDLLGVAATWRAAMTSAGSARYCCGNIAFRLAIFGRSKRAM